MVPYIALLIVLIVAILFAVYNRLDGFFVSEVNWTDKTTVKEIKKFYEDSLDEVTKLKDKIASATPFDDETITEEQLSELGLPYEWTQANGLQYEKPLSTLLAKTIEQERKMIFDLVANIRKDIQSDKIKETMTLSEAEQAMGRGGGTNMMSMSEFVNMAVKLRNKRKEYIDKKLGLSEEDIQTGGYPELKCPSGRPPFSRNGEVFCRDLLGKVSEKPLTCPTGTVPFFVFEPRATAICVPPTLPYAVNPQAMTSGGTIKSCKNGDMVGMSLTDNSQKCIPLQTPPVTTSSTTSPATTSSTTQKVAGVSVDDLFGAVGGVQQALKASKPGEVEKEQAPAPESSVASTKEMEERIAKNIATQLKDSLLVERATQNVTNDMSCPYAQYQSNAVDQGAEFRQAKPHPGPDMSEYIRKDSIPCWNCSLP